MRERDTERKREMYFLRDCQDLHSGESRNRRPHECTNRYVKDKTKTSRIVSKDIPPSLLCLLFSPQRTCSFGGSPVDVCMPKTSITPLAVTVLTLYCFTLWANVLHCRGRDAGWKEGWGLMSTFPQIYRETARYQVLQSYNTGSYMWRTLSRVT